MRSSLSTALLAASAFIPGQALAQSLVRDINTVAINAGSSPAGITSVLGGTVALFVANDGVTGSELWRSDGTSAGTFLLKDINPGSASSSPFNFTDHQGLVAFTATDGVNGNELWVTDGTALGTTIVKDIQPGAAASSPGVLRSFNGHVYFRATDATGAELWRSDLTAAGTVQVKDINTTTASASSNPNNLTAYNGLLYFTAGDGVNGTELWRSDGTAAGTVMVLNINTTSPTASGSPGNLTPVPGTALFFAATDGISGVELWKTDGTAAGTVQVADIRPGLGSSTSSLDVFRALGSKLLFTANDGVAGVEFWSSDGTAAGTALVLDIKPGLDNGVAGIPAGVAVLGSRLLFGAGDGTTGLELWSTDGTAAGTALVSDINPGVEGSTPSQMLTIGGVVFITAYHPAYGVELWKSDGTGAGTQLVKDIFIGTPEGLPRFFAAIGSVLVFQAVELISGNYELWKSDGTMAGTSLLKDINPPNTSTAGANPGGLVAYKDKVYFSANDGVSGNELWVSDGTAAGTMLLKDINPGASSGFNGPLRIVGGWLVFQATEPATGRELWRSDGTAAGTTLIKDLNPGPADGCQASGQSFAVFANLLIFAGNDGVSGEELWATDGTTTGTTQLMDINPGSMGSNPFNIVASLPYVYFQASDATNGGELWRTNGTAAGTSLVLDIHTGPSASNPVGFTFYAGRTYFAATTLATGSELWSTDGSTAGTSQLLEINPGSAGAFPGQFFVHGGRLFFSANDGMNGTELWSSNGTVAGTALWKDINTATNGSSSPTAFANVNGTLFFRAGDATNGTELWKSDGTPAGTVLVKDIQPGTGSGFFGTTVFQAGSGGTVLIPGNDGTTGTATGSEVWKSDGTAAGTQLVMDINPGTASSSPASFTRAGKTVFFTANTPSHGIELWSLPLSLLGAPLVENFGTGCPGTGSIVPRASTVGLPTLGNATFALEATQGLANTAALLFFNASRTDLNLGNGCFLYPTLPWILLTAPTNGSGHATVALPVPNLTDLVGGDVYWQWCVLDPQGAFQAIFSVSDAVRTVFGS